MIVADCAGCEAAAAPPPPLLQSAAMVVAVCCTQAAVNLLGSVLDTPEFFWSAPDQLQVSFCVLVQLAHVEAFTTMLLPVTLHGLL